MRIQLALTLLVVSFATSCAALAPADAGVPIEDMELAPREVRGSLTEQPIGPLVELMRGEVADVLVKMTAQAGANAVCIAAYRGSDGVHHCGVIPDAAAEPGPFLATFIGDTGADVTQVGGRVSGAVRSVVAVSVDGRRAEALLVPLEAAGIADQSAFILYLPPGSLHLLLAYGADDEELERLTLQRAP